MHIVIEQFVHFFTVYYDGIAKHLLGVKARRWTLHYHSYCVSHDCIYSLYADPAIWEYTGGQDDAPCDLQLRSGGGANTCGVSVYVSNDDHGGKSAQDIVMNDNDERIIYTGALATTALTFYYYEWTIDEEKHGRTYFADYDGKYLCVYAESPNFGYVESKIADLLGVMTLSENSK